MKTLFTRGLMAFALLTAGVALAQPVKIAGLLELTGSGQISGSNFDNGVKLAVKEINVAGGILGRNIEYRTYDTQSNPGVAKGLAEQVVGEGVYVVMGPVYSGSVMVSMGATRKAAIPNFTGGEAVGITREGNPYIFRTSIGFVKSMPRLAGYIQNVLKAKTIDLISVSNDAGRSARDELIKALAARGVKLGADISVDSGQINYAKVVRQARQSQGDILFVYMQEEESAFALRELRKQGYAKPIVGENNLTSQKVIERAGDAANGVIGHVSLTADAPNPLVKKFDRAFQAEYKTRADHNGLKGYIAMYTVKAVTEKIGKFDPKAFAAAMKNISLSVKDHPGLLLDLTYDDKGDLERESYMTRVVNGRQVVTETFVPQGKQ